MTNFKENPGLAKKLMPWAYIISVLVIGLVAIMGMVKVDTGLNLKALPPFHSVLNSITFCLLLLALYFIKQKNVKAHKNTIFLAMITSAIFLGSYVLYHIGTDPTKYCKHDWTRPIYFTILNTHILLAGVVFPFILISFIRGISYQIEKHKKLVKWVFPVWLYVSLTGPVIYLMLKSCY